MKHGVWRVVAIILVVLSGLWILQYLPTFTFLGERLEPVRLLSSLTTPNTAVLPTEALHDSAKCTEGMVCIDDYGQGGEYGMSHFYEALQRLQREPEAKVRIAFYGDSFIEADIVTGELRRLLQEAYGGSGVGFLPMRSDRNDAYRPTVSVAHRGWDEYEMVHAQAKPESLGIAGGYLTSKAGAYTEVRVKAGKPWEETAVYYATPQSQWRCVDGDTVLPTTLSQHGSVCVAKAYTNAHNVRWQLVSAPSHAVAWGMSVEGRGGIVLDNFSMRGETGLSLLGLSETRLADFQAIRPYDLIIFQYGLNIVTNKAIHAKAYFEQMRQVVAKFKRAFPHTSILVLGVSDRAQRQQGQYVTMPTIVPFAMTQRQMAVDEGIAFWNTYAAMQCDGGIVGMVHATPRCAAKDYTHVNHAGGARIAKHLYEAIHIGALHHSKLTAQP